MNRYRDSGTFAGLVGDLAGEGDSTVAELLFDLMGYVENDDIPAAKLVLAEINAYIDGLYQVDDAGETFDSILKKL